MTKKPRKNNHFWLAKACVYKTIREFFDSRKYVEVQTPVLTPHPGAEEYLDYFQVHWQQYLPTDVQKTYLRSSPELFLKNLLLEGMERIYELGPCFRNGSEFSPWHHPEFTMLEFYEQNISYEKFMDLTVELFIALVGKLRESSLTDTQIFDFKSIIRISVYDAFLKYIGIDLIDGDPDLALKVADSLKTSVRKDDDFETTYYKCMLEVLEPAFYHENVVILYDFPPSQAALSQVVDGRAKRFEFYLNGVEVSNAFLELSGSKANGERLAAINGKRQQIGKKTIDYQSPRLAFLDGELPQVCGNAIGIDRVVALLLGEQTIENVRPRNCLLPTRQGS